MSGFETQTAVKATGADQSIESARSSTWGDWLKHAGTSFAPLAVFVAGVLAYEAVVPPVRQAASPYKAVAARPAAGPAAPVSFDDPRSLLELARNVEAERLAATRLHAPGDVQVRTLAIAAGAPSRTALGFASGSKLPPGTYGAVRGIPADARLTHGLSVGGDIWLVDGEDLSLTAIEMRGTTPAQHHVELLLLGSDNRQLAVERIILAVQTAIEPPMPVAATRPAKPALSLADGTRLTAGRVTLVKLDITSSDKVPDGSYVLMRGLPAETSLAAGLPIGPDVWLLTLAEAGAVEVRLPVKASGPLSLNVRLVTVRGDLLAEASFPVDVVKPPSVAAVALKAVPTPPPVAEAAQAEAAAPAPGPAQSTRSATPAPVTAATPSPPLPPVKSKAELAEEKVAGNPVLARGRQLLFSGYVIGARMLLERAAVEGSGEAAALMGASFDPEWLRRAGAVGVAGDETSAKRWYDEAKRLGAGDVERVVGVPTQGPAQPAAARRRPG
jgi:hypothetical protein